MQAIGKFVLRPGVRVVRGPDWNGRKQDNGEGFLGTVIFVPKQGSNDNKVTVIWDSGRELRYRAGQDGKYDLRVFDTAPIGIVHTCNCSCCSAPIVGMRWKCADSACKDINLCSPCYMNDKHDVNHGFLRIDLEKASPWGVPARKGSKTMDSKGIFPKAEVMRGPHWKYKNQDGEEGQKGKVVSLENLDQKYYRGGVKVHWVSNNETHTYRLGGEGCVDVIYTRVKEPASGGKYYVEHLPLCDVVSPGRVQLKPSDKVFVSLTLRDFKQLQSDDAAKDGIFEWDDKMDQCTRDIGTITQIMHAGRAVKVQYENLEMFILNRDVITRKHTFSKDEAVSVLDNLERVRKLQEGHGGWNDSMKGVLGRSGRIVKVESDGDVKLKVDAKTWIFSPVCISPVSDVKVAQEILGSTPANDAKDDADAKIDSPLGQSMNDVAGKLAQLFVDMLRDQAGVTRRTSIDLIHVTQQRDLESVKKFVKQHPDQIDQAKEGKTALHVASYEGYPKIVDFLLENKANKDMTDEEGDTPLHYAAYGMEPETMKSLIKHNADKNKTNSKGQSPLHVAVGKGCPKCTELLIKCGVDVNIKDHDKDTAMHDAIQQKDNPQIMEMVLMAKGADYRIPNNKDFNVLHWAIMNNSLRAVDIILKKDAKMVNVPTADEKATPLHLAALNNFSDITGLLLKKRADVNLGDKANQTALHLAVLSGHQRIVELLVSSGCNVNAQERSGNTPLHLAQSKKAMAEQLAVPVGEQHADAQIISYLLESQADLSIKNKDGNTPLDLAADPLVKKSMEIIADKAKNSTLAKTKKGVMLPSHWDPMDCTLMRIKIRPEDGGMAKMEYDNVSKKFHQTLPQARIFCVERVQNVYLRETYYLKKKKMESDYGDGCANQIDLFHGTLPELVAVIAKENLDFRLAGDRTGAIFGQGAYFAVEAKYSDMYAKRDEQGHKFMILAKVLAGKYCVGYSHYRRPPPMNPSDKFSPLYDSCVDNEANPQIYCLFDKPQYYPEYIIEYV